MRIYAGYCIVRDNADIYKIVKISKTDWEAKRAVLGWLLDDAPLFKDYQKKNNWASNITYFYHTRFEFTFKNKLENYFENNQFNSALFLKCEDIEVIQAMWDNLDIAWFFWDSIDWGIESEII